MSRTKKGKKAPGYEYWSKRPTPGTSGSIPGKEAKRFTHKAERRQSKKQIKEQTDE